MEVNPIEELTHQSVAAGFFYNAWIVSFKMFPRKESVLFYHPSTSIYKEFHVSYAVRYLYRYVILRVSK